MVMEEHTEMEGHGTTQRDQWLEDSGWPLPLLRILLLGVIIIDSTVTILYCVEYCVLLLRHVHNCQPH